MAARASARVLKTSLLRHSSRSLPLKPSTKALCCGLPGAIQCQPTSVRLIHSRLDRLIILEGTLRRGDPDWPGQGLGPAMPVTHLGRIDIKRTEHGSGEVDEGEVVAGEPVEAGARQQRLDPNPLRIAQFMSLHARHKPPPKRRPMNHAPGNCESLNVDWSQSKSVFQLPK